MINVGVTVTTGPLEQGRRFLGFATVHNGSDAAIIFDCDTPLSAYLLDADGGVKGLCRGYSSGMHKSMAIGPMDEGTVDLIGGTWSSRDGSLLTPVGFYTLTVPIDAEVNGAHCTVTGRLLGVRVASPNSG